VLSRAAVLALVAAVPLGALTVLAGCGGSEAGAGNVKTNPPAASASTVKLDAPGTLEPAKQAPEIALRNYTGQPVRLSQYRGKAVLLTFIYDHCPDTCPLIVSKLHAALEVLGSKASEVQIVAVSVDPIGDTPKTVKAFLKVHQMTGRMDYLIGSEKQLAPVWKEYDISASGSPDSREAPEHRTVSHTALVYGITAKGRWLALYDDVFKPSEIAHDVPLLASQ
jgi:protein SCO1